MLITIEQLNIYPVKSLGGISLPSATLTQTGLSGDREWMLIDDNGDFATQRKYPLMATIHPSLTNDQLTLTNINGDSIILEQPQNTRLINVTIWKDQLPALQACREVSEWITHSVQATKPLQLVYFDKSVQRNIDEVRFGHGYTFFSDGAPYLVSNTESLTLLNDDLTQQQLPAVTMDRFRANIVISGVPAFGEHQIKQLRSDSTSSIIGLKDHCKRCSVITIDPANGVRSTIATPLKQLVKINSMPEKKNKAAFGVNSVLIAGENNTINVGETFTL